MLHEKRKNNCGLVIAWAVIVFFIAFAFPPLLILFIILIFTWNISIKKITNSLSKTCFWDSEYIKKDYEKIVDAFKPKHKTPSQISRKPEIKKAENINNDSLYPSKREYKNQKRELKYEKKSSKTDLVVWWQRQKSIWDDYESALDKFKK